MKDREQTHCIFQAKRQKSGLPSGVQGDHHRCGKDCTPGSEGKWNENGGKLSLGAACRAEGPFRGTALQMCDQGSLNRPKDGDGTPLEERQKRAEDKDANLLCLAAKARAGLKDAALPGVLGRRHGTADDRPAGVGGGRLDPREVGEPTACTGQQAAWRPATRGPGAPRLTAPSQPIPSPFSPAGPFPTRQPPTSRSCSLQLLPEVVRPPPAEVHRWTPLLGMPLIGRGGAT